MLIRIIISYVLLILALHIVPTGFSGIALNELEVVIFRADYLLHTAVFLPWMILIWLYLNEKNIVGSTRLKYAILWLCTGVFLAVFAEGIQYWIPYRGFNVMDIVYNVLGVFLGCVIFLYKPGGKRYRTVNDAPK